MKLLNPHTQRWVKADGKIGQRLIADYGIQNLVTTSSGKTASKHKKVPVARTVVPVPDGVGVSVSARDLADGFRLMQDIMADPLFQQNHANVNVRVLFQRVAPLTSMFFMQRNVGFSSPYVIALSYDVTDPAWIDHAALQKANAKRKNKLQKPWIERGFQGDTYGEFASMAYDVNQKVFHHMNRSKPRLLYVLPKYGAQDMTWAFVLQKLREFARAPGNSAYHEIDYDGSDRDGYMRLHRKMAAFVQWLRA
jgi:hypothetical protein